MDPGLEGALLLGALVYGGVCGSALGLVGGLGWFLVVRWSARRRPAARPSKG